MTDTKRIEHGELERFFKASLLAVGVPEHVADVEAQIGAEVDLCGVHSHGVRMLSGTVNGARNGSINVDPQLDIVVDHAASVLVEAARGIGRYASAMATDSAVERAREFGVGVVTMRGVGHWGRAHSYCLRAARAGMVSLVFTNAIALFPAVGATEKTLGNNPIGIGIPAANPEESVILDLAVTQASVGKVAMAAMRGETSPLDWGLDKRGEPTDDPRAIMESRYYLPMGGYKGAGLSFAIDLLTAGLANAAFAFEQGAGGRPSDWAGGSTKTFIAIKPYGDWLNERVDTLKTKVISTGETVRWPGEGSFARRRDYLQDGISILPPIAESMEKLSDELSIPLRWKR